MSDIAGYMPWTTPRAKAEDTPRKPPAPVRPGPVLIHDAVVPADGATLLLRMWQRWDDDGASGN